MARLSPTLPLVTPSLPRGGNGPGHGCGSRYVTPPLPIGGGNGNVHAAPQNPALFPEGGRRATLPLRRRPNPYASEAKRSGDFVESIVEREFGSRGAPAVQWVNRRSIRPDLFMATPRGILFRNVPFRTLYRSQGWTEFVFNWDGTDLIRIECKRQVARGSLDEKFPYLFANARDHMPERVVWIILDGRGARPAAMRWLSDKCSACTSKRIVLGTVSDIPRLVRDTFDQLTGETQ